MLNIALLIAVLSSSALLEALDLGSMDLCSWSYESISEVRRCCWGAVGVAVYPSAVWRSLGFLYSSLVSSWSWSWLCALSLFRLEQVWGFRLRFRETNISDVLHDSAIYERGMHVTVLEASFSFNRQSCIVMPWGTRGVERKRSVELQVGALSAR